MNQPLKPIKAMPARRPQPHNQEGVVLIVVLVLLVAVTFMSVSVMRGAMSSDLLTNNARTQSLAMEATQAALRYCENDLRLTSGAELFKDSPQIIAKAASVDGMAWKQKSKWLNAGIGNAKNLTEDQLKSKYTAVMPKKMPQCIAEYDPLADNVIVVTARGFSPDYKEDDKQAILNGSVIWLQSKFIFASGGGGTETGTGTGTTTQGGSGGANTGANGG